MKYPPITYELMEEKLGDMEKPWLRCQAAFMKHAGREGVLTRDNAMEAADFIYWPLMAVRLLDKEDYQEWNKQLPPSFGIEALHLFFDIYGEHKKSSLVDKMVRSLK
jgi:hypothetical protein